MLWRAALLLALGLTLQELDHGVHVILPTYALLFVIALPALLLPDRILLATVGLLAVLGPVAHLAGATSLPLLFPSDAATLSDAGDATTMLPRLFAGPYPLLTWSVPLLFGMWLGRRDLRDPRLHRRMVGGGLVVAVMTAGTTVAAKGRWGEADREVFELPTLLSSAPHSQTMAWVIGACASACFVLGLALWAVRGRERGWWPLAALGQLALTVYVAHLLALHAAPDAMRADSPVLAGAIVIGFVGASTLFAVTWRGRFTTGPLEAVLRVPWPAGGRRSVPASARRPREQIGVSRPGAHRPGGSGTPEPLS